MIKKQFVLMAAAIICNFSVMADITLPQFFSDNMIVQRNAQLTIPGTATPNSKITITADWGVKPVHVKADADGKFSAQIATPEAGGPYTIIINDGNDSKVLTNVLSGEVWLCSGQSNMEYPVKGWTDVMGGDFVVNTSQHPDIRMLRVEKQRAFAPEDDCKVRWGQWVEANPAHMNFSAIAYLYALQLKEELGVPVGVIDSSWGGTVAEAWTDWQHLNDFVPGFESELKAIKDGGFTQKGPQEAYDAHMRAWNDALTQADQKFDLSVMQTSDDWAELPVGQAWERTVLPGFDGVVWAQTEIDLPTSAAGKALSLHLGAIDDIDITYLNGKEVGSNNAYNIQREYEVSGELVKSGKNVISVKMVDPQGEGGFIGPKNNMFAEVDGQRYPLTTGWQYAIGADMRKLPKQPADPASSNYPTVLYNAMVHPLHVMPLRGVIWYQGCSNVGRAEQYEVLFPTLIKNWRELWKQPDMPFYFVQLSAFEHPKNLQPDSQWAALRNAQTKALALPNTGMAVTIDLGHPTDIHPRDKAEVARRLGIIALNRDYGKDIVYEAPVLKEYKTKGNKIILTFTGKIVPSTCALTGFIVGDANGNFAYANARQTADNVIEVSSPLIAKPTIARYDWADYPNGNLYSVEKLPISPFATDK